MHSLIKVSTGVLAAAALALLLGAHGAGAEAPRLALHGYDPVAYFTEGKPVKGDARLVHDWDESRYYFASARHRDMFVADPERYAPRFSGFCASALLDGSQFEADPEYWSIIDGRLYVFGSRDGKARFEKNPDVKRANRAWHRAQ